MQVYATSDAGMPISAKRSDRVEHLAFLPTLLSSELSYFIFIYLHRLYRKSAFYGLTQKNMIIEVCHCLDNTEKLET